MKPGLKNLKRNPSSLPAREAVIVDTNLLVPQVLSTFMPQEQQNNIERAGWFFDQAVEKELAVYATPTVVVELLGVFIKAKLKDEVRSGRRETKNEDLLYKTCPWLLKDYAKEMNAILDALDAFGVGVLQPDEVPGTGTKRWERAILDYIRKYQLNTADAAILLEASRAGYNSVVTLDKDFVRAKSDFVVFTWID